MDFVAGTEYFYDLDRVKDARTLTKLDVARAQALSDYLGETHAAKRTDLVIYTRRMRDLVGHGELIMGLIDSYPRTFDVFTQDDFRLVDTRCID